MTTEKEKMLSGEMYDASDPQLIADRLNARELLRELNTSRYDRDLLQAICARLFGVIGANFWVEPPFACDYGGNIYAGDNVYFNFNCVILDVARVDIGDNVMCGPAVQIYTASHPLDYQSRNSGLEFGKPIRIGSNVWIGGGAIICPGVTIGDGSVIGAGSVVTKDIPAGVFAAGNPCRVLRQLEGES